MRYFKYIFFLFLTWQDPNQFIRASALRVLSSIRVPIIVPIMMLAIKEAATDMSPYVRKTSAHAIQKLYRYRTTNPQHTFLSALTSPHSSVNAWLCWFKGVGLLFSECFRNGWRKEEWIKDQRLKYSNGTPAVQCLFTVARRWFFTGGGSV